MKAAVQRYFADLNAAVGAAWNRFWYAPAAAAPLGLVRAATGALAFYAVASYGPDLIHWFDAQGMLPVSTVRELYPDQYSLLDYVSGSGLWAVFAAALVATGALALGVGGRIAAVAALVLTLSFFHRAPLLTGEFEAVLAFLLAYQCLGRGGDAFSLAAWWRTKQGKPPAPPAASNRVALRLIQVHIAVVHAMMAVAMFAAPGGVWFSGEGLWLAAATPGASLIDVTRWSEHTKIIALASHAVTAYFVAFPLLAWNSRVRPLLLAVAAGVWVVLAILTGSPTFCLAMAAGVAAFTPAAWLTSPAADGDAS